MEQLLQEQGYEPGVISRFATSSARLLMKRRSVTAVEQERVDQAVIAGPFPQRSLGGEKVFILLERLIREPKRYRICWNFSGSVFLWDFAGATKGSTGSGGI